jgi:hypothetical protein
LCGSDDLPVELAFDQWRQTRACEHEDGILVHHYIGNIALVGFLRNELQRASDQFPMILEKVLYNGTHCGDFIAVADLPRLRSEVVALREIHCAEPGTEQCLRSFHVADD